MESCYTIVSFNFNFKLEITVQYIRIEGCFTFEFKLLCGCHNKIPLYLNTFSTTSSHCNSHQMRREMRAFIHVVAFRYTSPVFVTTTCFQRGFWGHLPLSIVVSHHQKRIIHPPLIAGLAFTVAFREQWI